MNIQTNNITMESFVIEPRHSIGHIRLDYNNNGNNLLFGSLNIQQTTLNLA